MKKYFLILILVTTYFVYLIGMNREPIEDVDLIVGVGYDITEKQPDKLEYKIIMESEVFKSVIEEESVVKVGKGNSLEDAAQNRDTKMNKQFRLGNEEMYLISEKYARFGIKTIMENRFRSREVNHLAYLAVCSGSPLDYFNLKIKGYNSAADYINGMVENLKNFNFFSDDYKIVDCYTRVAAEGRNILLPYIELKKNNIDTTGIAVFKNYNMIYKLGMDDVKYLNLLRNNKTQGVLSIKKNYKEYTDFLAVIKSKKIKCYKDNGNYTFDIIINLNGAVIDNTLYKDLIKEKKVMEVFQKDLQASVEKNCYKFINKMQKEYKTDLLELGRVFIAKYGRRKNYKLDDIISNAKINIKVKIKVNEQGRGDY